jgi:hypothetical protein
VKKWSDEMLPDGVARLESVELPTVRLTESPFWSLGKLATSHEKEEAADVAQPEPPVEEGDGKPRPLLRRVQPASDAGAASDAAAREQKKAFLHTPLEVPKFTHEQMRTLVDTWDHYLPDLDLVPRDPHRIPRLQHAPSRARLGALEKRQRGVLPSKLSRYALDGLKIGVQSPERSNLQRREVELQRIADEEERQLRNRSVARSKTQ